MTTSIFTIIKDKKNFSEDFLKLVNRVNEHKVVFPHEWTGEVNIESKINTALSKKEIGGCSRALESMDVLWDGRVVPCCTDLNGRGVIGNLNENTLLEIYKGEKRISLLNKMKKGQRFEINLCKDCREL